MHFRIVRTSLIAIVLTVATTLSAQSVWTDPEKLSANHIKTITIEECRQEFGKPDSCTIGTINTYDQKGRLIEAVSQPDEAFRYQGTYTYNEKGQRIKVQHISRSDTTTTTDEYDGKGRKVKSVTKKNSKIVSVTMIQYDETKLISSVTKNDKGEIFSESTYTYDQSGKLRTSLWTNKASDYTSITWYNQEGRRVVDSVMNFTGELSAVYTYEYRNDTLSSRKTFNLKGFVSETRYIYDSLQRLIRCEVVDSTNPYNTYTTEYKYDVAGNLIETTDYRGAGQFSRQYAYDDDGKLISETNNSGPERVVRSYTYSGKGELLTVTDTEHSRDSIINEYNGNGLKIHTKVIQSGIVNTTDYTYDDKGYLINEKKYLQIRSDSALFYYEIEYHNDNEGKHVEAIYKDYTLRNLMARLGSKNNTTPPSAFTMLYAYDERDSLVSITGATAQKDQRVGEQTIRYNYGPNGKVQEVRYYYPGTDHLKSRTVHEYDDSGKVILMKFYLDNGETPYITYRYFYDSNNRLTHTCEYSRWGELIEHTVNIYDEDGRLVKVVDGGKGLSYRRYTYETY